MSLTKLFPCIMLLLFVSCSYIPPNYSTLLIEKKWSTTVDGFFSIDNKIDTTISYYPSFSNYNFNFLLKDKFALSPSLGLLNAGLHFGYIAHNKILIFTGGSKNYMNNGLNYSIGAYYKIYKNFVLDYSYIRASNYNYTTIGLDSSIIPIFKKGINDIRTVNKFGIGYSGKLSSGSFGLLKNNDNTFGSFYINFTMNMSSMIKNYHKEQEKDN